jgi:predicted nucleic-acid-binding Zn-ribbon protein
VEEDKRKWTCAKCGNEEYETAEVVMKKKQIFAFSSPTFHLIICKKCKFAEFYESGSTFWLMDN